jgi:hypothetical protein
LVNKNKKTITSFGPLPLVVIDASRTTKVDSSTFIAQSGYKTRQCVAMNELRYSVSNLEKNYSYDLRNFVSSTGNNMEVDQIHSFQLFQNYPNPFNAQTKIKFTIPQGASNNKVKIKLFNILGEEVKNLLNEELEPGYHEVDFNTSHISSGVYIYRIEWNDKFKVKKMMMIK